MLVVLLSLVATDSTREKKYVPRSLRFQRILLLKAENNNYSLRSLEFAHQKYNLMEG